LMPETKSSVPPKILTVWSPRIAFLVPDSDSSRKANATIPQYDIERKEKMANKIKLYLATTNDFYWDYRCLYSE